MGREESQVDLLQEGGRLPGPEGGLLSSAGQGIVRGDTLADRAGDFIEAGHPGESSRVKEPRRTVLPRRSRSWVLGSWG